MLSLCPACESRELMTIVLSHHGRVVVRIALLFRCVEKPRRRQLHFKNGLYHD